MTRLEHVVTIQKPLKDVYQLACQVERYPEFLPGYKESRILQQDKEGLLLQRQAVLQGKVITWKSMARFTPDEAIDFVHVEGPLKGMHAGWQFQSLSSEQTRLSIIHTFNLPKRWGWGWLIEKIVYKRRLDRIAADVVQAFRYECERN